MIERLTVLRGEGEIRLEDLPANLRERGGAHIQAPAIPAEGISLREMLDDLETELIVQALEKNGWNQTRAASDLGMNRTTLIEKMKKRGLERPPTS